MKCPECSSYHRYKSGMTCACGYRFALDPKKMEFADNKIVHSAKKASGEFTNWYTMNQLTSAADTGSSNAGCFVVGIGLGLASIAAYALSLGFWPLTAVIAVVIIVVGFVSPTKIDDRKFKAAVEYYEKEKGQLDKRLVNNQPLAEPPPPAVEQDLYDYGVESLVICDRDVLVDLLVLNHWAAENKALVVSEKGYPPYLVERANDILRDQPEMPVFVLHDASPSGDIMSERVQASTLYNIGDREVIDLGLARSQVKRGKLMKSFAESDGSVPIDHVGWARMAPVFIGAMAGQMAISELITRQAAGGTESYYDGGGFG